MGLRKRQSQCGLLLQLNRYLGALDLSSNAIDIDGITAIAEALRENDTLEGLKLGCASGVPLIRS